MVSIVNANTAPLIVKAKALFLEYAKSLNFDLCFQNFDQELKEFPSQYAPPSGSLFLAFEDEQAIGCVGIRMLERSTCEMKRLFVKPEFRGLKAGRLLAEAAITAGISMNYESMRLDTIPSMQSANHLYKSLGFKPIPPYRYNPFEDAIYMELTLKAQAPA